MQSCGERAGGGERGKGFNMGVERAVSAFALKKRRDWVFFQEQVGRECGKLWGLQGERREWQRRNFENHFVGENQRLSFGKTENWVTEERGVKVRDPLIYCVGQSDSSS